MDPLDAARALLPFWIRWSDTILYLTVACASGLGISWLIRSLASRPLRALGPRASWMERARVSLPIRRYTLMSVWLAIFVLPFCAYCLAKPLSPLPPVALAVLVGAGGCSGTLYVRVRSEEEITRTRIGLRRAVRDVLSWAILRWWPVILILLEWTLVPARLGLAAWLLIGGGLAVFVAGISGGSFRFARLVGLAKPASPRLARIVDDVASRVTSTPSTRAGTRVARFDLRPTVFEVPIVRANALALPLANVLAFTEGAIAALSDDELGAIAAHELGHLTESRRVGVVRAATGALLIAGLAAERGIASLLSSFAWGAHIVAALAVYAPILLFARFVVKPLANRMEKRADAIAHAHEHAEGGYARALARLYEVNLFPVVLGAKRAVHPDLYDRLVASGAPPDYPRPRPPDARRGRLLQFVATLLFAAGAAAPSFVESGVVASSKDGTIHGAELALAFTGDVWHLGELARLKSAAGASDMAATLYAACEQLDPSSVHYPANAATVLASAGRCTEAGAALDRALLRFNGDPSDTSAGRAIATAERARTRCKERRADE